MDLRQLEILRAVVETGSFTGAGRRLNVSQSAISRQILLLEDELNEPLFLRVGRRVRITATGETLLSLGRRVLADIDETRASILDAGATLTGTMRLVGGMTVCLYVFPDLLKQFRRLHPSVEVRLTTGNTARLIRRLLTGTADLGLLTLPIDHPNLVSMPMMREELLLVTSPTHALARRREVASKDLARQTFVLFESGSNSRRVIDQFFVREQIAPKVAMETENVEIIKAFVRAGLGVAIVPYQAIAREVHTGALNYARIAGAPIVRETGWVYLRTERVPRMTQEMMNTLAKALPRLKLVPPSRRS
jgi:DNA-binding transcriptional LysR family regulator